MRQVPNLQIPSARESTADLRSSNMVSNVKAVFSKFVFRFLPGLLGFCNCLKAAETNLPALNLIGAKRPVVIGHRGYCQFAPESTLPSFKLAVAAGPDLVELDYYHTKDVQLIL